MLIVIMGPPYSGKTTQGQLLSQRLGLPFLDSSAVLKPICARHLDFQARIEAGRYLPDQVVNIAWQQRLEQSDARAGAVIAGYPRNLAQRQYFEGIVANGHHQWSWVGVVILDLGENLSNVRREDRFRQAARSGGEPRADDLPSKFAARWQEYREKTAPLIEWVISQSILPFFRNRFAADRPDEIASHILDWVERQNKKLYPPSRRRPKA